MSIFLWILKIIGIALLVILGFLTGLVLLVLFCPFTFRVYGSSHRKKTDVHIRVFWLFYLLGFGMDMEESGSKSYLRVCGIRKSLEKGHKSGKSEDTIEQAVWKESDSYDSGNTPSSEVTIMENEKPESGEKGSSDTKSDGQEHFSSPPEYHKMSRIKIVWEKLKKIPMGIRSAVQKIPDTIQEIRFMFKNWKRTGKKVLSLLRDERCQRAFHGLWEKMLSFLGNLKPKKMKLTLQYSTGSPDTTGILLGVLSMFPAAYQNRWDISPDFTADSYYAEADFDIRGHLFGIQILSLALQVVLDEDSRRLYNRLKRMK